MKFSACTVVASTIPATTRPATSSAAVIVPAAMLLATMVCAAISEEMIVPAWIVFVALNKIGAHADPFHWEISPVPELIQISFVFGFAGAPTLMVTRLPPRVRMEIPSFSIAGVIDPFRMTCPRPLPGAVDTVGLPPGICAVWIVPGDIAVSHAVSGTELNANVHSFAFSVSEYPHISCFVVVVAAVVRDTSVRNMRKAPPVLCPLYYSHNWPPAELTRQGS